MQPNLLRVKFAAMQAASLHMRTPFRKLLSLMPFAGELAVRLLPKTSSIFMLHRVLPSNVQCYDKQMNTPPEVLDQFFGWLKRDFDVLPLEDFLRLRKSRNERGKPTCAVTFDDGWQDNYEHGYPLLKKHQIPATIFLVTNFIGTNRRFWQERLWRTFVRLGSFASRDWIAEKLWRSFPWCPQLSAIDLDFSRVRQLLLQRSSLDAEEFVTRLEEFAWRDNELETTERAFLNWDEVHEMQANGIRFGSHTENHTLLTRTAPARASMEIENSKKRLREMLDEEISFFSYPWGSTLGHIRQQVAAAGYRWAFVTERPSRKNDVDPFLTSRIPVSGPLLTGNEGSFDRREARLSIGLVGLQAHFRKWPIIRAEVNEPMRIAYVIDSIDGWDGGGTEVQLRHLLAALDRRFFQPALFFLIPSRRMRNEDFPCPVYVAKRGILPGTLSLVPDLTRSLRKFRPHLVQTFFRDGTLCGTIAAKFARVPVLVQSERNLGYWMTARDRVIQRCLRAMSDGLHCNSRTIYDSLRQTVPQIAGRVEILPNFLDINYFSPADEGERSVIRKRLGIPDRRPVLVSVAHLCPVKNLIKLIHAAALVHAVLPEAYFVLVGEGPLRGALIEEIRSFRLETVVRLAGAQQDVRSWLAAADLGVLTSTSEGSSNAVLEYMGVGLPAILSDIPANRELVDGPFFTTDDASELAQTIISIWNSPKERDRLSSEYRRRALQYGKAPFQERAQGFYVRMMAGAV